MPKYRPSFSTVRPWVYTYTARNEWKTFPLYDRDDLRQLAYYEFRKMVAAHDIESPGHLVILFRKRFAWRILDITEKRRRQTTLRYQHAFNKAKHGGPGEDGPSEPYKVKVEARLADAIMGDVEAPESIKHFVESVQHRHTPLHREGRRESNRDHRVRRRAIDEVARLGWAKCSNGLLCTAAGLDETEIRLDVDLGNYLGAPPCRTPSRKARTSTSPISSPATPVTA